jgi:ornithine decarboxylase
MKKEAIHQAESPFTPDLIAKYSKETPFFIFSKQRIKEAYQLFEKYFPHSMIQFAMKANAEPEVLETLRDLGSGFEVASVYELEMLKKIGVSPDKIIYGTSVKPPFHIKEFFAYDVDRFAFDSLSELEKIATIAPGSRVYVRVTVNDTGSVFKFSEKFGTQRENVVSYLMRASQLGLVPYGISFHVGSQASNPKAWAEAIEWITPSIIELQKNGITIETIDIGGGFPCNKYTSSEQPLEMEEIAGYFYEAYNKLPYQPKIMLEPGRALVAEAGILVANVIARVERTEHVWLFLDVGVYGGLFETMVYQGSTRYRVTMLRPSYEGGEMAFALAGPTGDSPDVITREVFLPSDISIGDKLIIHDVGAYSLVAICPFNGFPKPDIHFI